MLQQAGIAFWIIVAGLVSLVVGLTGVVFGWHRQAEVIEPTEPPPPDSILRLSELPDLHGEPTVSTLYSDPRAYGPSGARLDPRDQARRLPSDRPRLGQARKAVHP
jgi:hypothetical protein